MSLSTASCDDLNSILNTRSDKVDSVSSAILRSPDKGKNVEFGILVCFPSCETYLVSDVFAGMVKVKVTA